MVSKLSWPKPNPNIDLKSLNFDKITLPLMRNHYPSLMAKQLVSVQPMDSNLLPDLLEALKEREILEKEFIKEEEFRV
jgi:hypothetical protein